MPINYISTHMAATYVHFYYCFCISKKFIQIERFMCGLLDALNNLKTPAASWERWRYEMLIWQNESERKGLYCLTVALYQLTTVSWALHTHWGNWILHIWHCRNLIHAVFGWQSSELAVGEYFLPHNRQVTKDFIAFSAQLSASPRHDKDLQT